MALIYETENFIVEAVDKPHITRTDGGHIKIYPRERELVDRTQLSSRLAIELMRLTMVVGEAMQKIMNEQGVDIGRINYQDNGNWSVFKPEGPYLHIHLYGRAKSAKIQKYGQTIFLPHREEDPDFYKNYEPLNEVDVRLMKEEISKIFTEEKYQDKNWHL